MVTFRSGPPTFARLYDVTQNQWRPSQITEPNVDREGMYAVMDPTTSRVYIAGGFAPDGVKMNKMVIYHFDTDTVTELDIPPSGVRFTGFYKSVWSPKTNSILYFGGYNYDAGMQVENVITQFSPNLNLWSTLPSTGVAPGRRQDHCMEISEDGSRLVVFGGRIVHGLDYTFLKDIYILDLNVMLWRRGPDYASPIIYSACAIVGSTFLSWGGKDQDNSTIISSAAILYDLNSNQYISQFVPPPLSRTTIPPSTLSESGSKGHSKTLATVGVLCLFIYTFSFDVLTQAQYVVAPVSQAAYARSGSGLYICGGNAIINTVLQPISQFIVLDLSVSWNATQPSWTELASGPTQVLFPASFSADGNTMITFRSGPPTFARLYDVTQNQWRPSQITEPNVDREGMYAAMDPTTGRVYIAGGFAPDGVKMNKMVIYHFDTDTVTELDIPPSGVQDTCFYKSVWSPKTSSILYFGGYKYDAGMQVKNVITQYSPSLNLWSTLPATGVAPSPRQDHCMEISEDGSQLVVFGGRVIQNGYIFLSDIYILDLNTMVWRRGPDYTSPIIYSACAIVGSTFISWGGKDQDMATNISPTAILYDLNSNQYITQFVPPPPSATRAWGPKATAKSTSTPTSVSVSNDSSDAVLIAGCVIGSLGLIALVVGYMSYKRRAKFSPIGTSESKPNKAEFNEGSEGIDA
ncbi:hypothetical protein BGX28_000030 [Mortierella sp. GBA30]|nr:hypothetical protein BGX28_000030 [Mortierella sp. GBA30]